jgi:hypothetical protein
MTEILRHYCKCGYSTTVDTGILLHLHWVNQHWWQRLLNRHHWTHSKPEEGAAP